MIINSKQAKDFTIKGGQIVYANSGKTHLKSEVCCIENGIVYFTEAFDLRLNEILFFEAPKRTPQQRANKLKFERIMKKIYINSRKETKKARNKNQRPISKMSRKDAQKALHEFFNKPFKKISVI